MSFSFSTTKSIISAANSTTAVGEQCRKLRMSNVLIVTDPGIIKLGLHQGIIESLQVSDIVDTQCNCRICSVSHTKRGAVLRINGGKRING